MTTFRFDCPVCGRGVEDYEVRYGYDAESQPIPERNRWSFQPCGDTIESATHFDRPTIDWTDDEPLTCPSRLNWDGHPHGQVPCDRRTLAGRHDGRHHFRWQDEAGEWHTINWTDADAARQP